MKLYVRRMFIADDIDILPGYLRFVSGIVDSADLPLNLSRETIQESTILGAIRKGVTNRVISELEKLADKEPERYAKVWEAFGPVIKEGLYEDYERRDGLYALSRFASSTHPEGGRSLKQYIEALRPNQTAIWYLVGDDAARLKASPHLEGFRARGVEVLLLSDPVDAFWVQSAIGLRGQAVQVGDAGRGRPRLRAAGRGRGGAGFGGDLAPGRDRARLHEGQARRRGGGRAPLDAAGGKPRLPRGRPRPGPDRGLERLLAAHGRIKEASKPVLEINPGHALVVKLAEHFGSGDRDMVEDAALPAARPGPCGRGTAARRRRRLRGAAQPGAGQGAGLTPL